MSRNKLYWVVGLFMVIGLLVGVVQPAFAGTSQPPTTAFNHIVTRPQHQSGPMYVVYPSKHDVSPPLRTLKGHPRTAKELAEIKQIRTIALRPLPKMLRTPKDEVTDPAVVQTSVDKSKLASMPAPLASFDGIYNTYGVLPPDTNGDIGYDPNTGKKYYFQIVNLGYAVWDVTDPANPTQVIAPTDNNAMWSGFGGICESNNDGDPIVLFDHLANRWLFSQFALDFDNNKFYQCIAVSASADPTGEWNRYSYQIPSDLMNDYPKFGVWPDAYYMTANQFDPNNNWAWAGAGVFAFERSKMLTGETARMVYINVGAVTQDYGGMLPADLDGTAPPAGTPGYFVEWDDSSWLGDPQDTLRIWEFHVNWDDTSASTFGANSSYDPNYMVGTSDVDPNIGQVDQPNGVALDTIADRLMYRLAFRAWDDGTFSMVSNHTVNADGNGHAGIHWFELKWDGSTWSLAQDGVYAPSDGNSRWMGSIAMDVVHDMALGYSITGPSKYPSVYFTGRLAGDPAGEMGDEGVIVEGGGSQSHSSGRWGDYSMMGVDPEDGCTFWYTQEYYPADSTATWYTRIGAFKFESCTNGPAGALEGTVTDANTGDPVAGAIVEITDLSLSTTTDENGHYAFTTVPVGTYTVTASKFGYTEASASVDITDGNTTTQDFALTPKPRHEVTFHITDSDGNWPLYAKVDISGDPEGPFFTDPTTGVVVVSLPEDTYTVTVHAMTGGYIDGNDTQAITADTDWDFALAADLVSCSAPGYAFTPGFSEDFDSGWPPSGWTIKDNAGTGVIWKTNSDWGEGNYTGGAGEAATASSDAVRDSAFDTELITPSIDPSTLPGLTLVYDANYQNFAGQDSLDLDISTDGGTNWQTLLHWAEDHGALHSKPGERVVVDLSSVATGSFQLRWHYYDPDSNAWDWYAEIDDVAIGGCVRVDDGIILGTVTDANTGQEMPSVTVEDGDGRQAAWFDASADPATPQHMFVISEKAGSVDLHTTNFPPGYNAASATVDMTAGAAIRQDFALTAPMLSMAPDSLNFEFEYLNPRTDSDTVTLSNTGTADANAQILAVKGAAMVFGTAPEEGLERFALGNFSDMVLKHLRDKDARNAAVTIPSFEKPLHMPIAADAGELISSWATGLPYAWGIGVDKDTGNPWIGNITAGGNGGEDKDYEYTPDGTQTGNAIDLTSWDTYGYAADMAYDPFTHTFWQIDVGSDYCIHEIDPVSLVSTGKRICNDYNLSLRGLAFDPTTNTFIAGTWNYGGYVFRLGMNGAILDYKKVNLPISGLAYNPSTGHLFAMVNTNTQNTGAFDVYVLDVNNGYSVLGMFNVHQPGGSDSVISAGGQAAMGFACDGALWAIDQNANKALSFKSGEDGWCDWQADWVTVDPANPSVGFGTSQDLNVQVDLTGKPAGTYKAHLVALATTPYYVAPVNITAVVKPLNDDPDNAIALNVPDGVVVNDASPYTFISTDPIPSCVTSRVGGTAWYTVTTTEDKKVNIDTFSSDFDTVLAVYANSPDAANEVACSDDASGTQSQVTFDATAGTTYYIMVGAKNEGTDGELHLHATSFTDVPGSFWAWSYIEAIKSSLGIQGYGDGNYHPADTVTRAQMAKFILLAVHGAGYTPPSFDTYSFPDIADNWAADWIEEAHQEGIVNGYSDGNYHPADPVNRAQMTKFVLLAKHGAGYTPPSFDTYSFPDIADNWAADWIEEAHQEGIVNGYSDGNYHPADPVNRAQMAVFLARGFDLAVPTLLK